MWRRRQKSGNGRSIDYKILTKNEIETTAKRNGFTVYDFSNVDMPYLARIGVIDKETDLQELAGQDLLKKQGKLLRLSLLDTIFTDIHGLSAPHTLCLLDSQKRIVKRYGADEVGRSSVCSSDVPVGLSPLQYVRVQIHVPVSGFCQASIGSILLSILFTIIVFICVGCQLSAIHRIRNVVKRLQSPLSSILLLLSGIKEGVEDAATRTMIAEAEETTEDLALSIKTYLKETTNKPFKADKLVAWVKRYASDGSESSKQVRLGDCLLFMDRHAIGYPDGNERTLTRMEYETLRLLVINQGDVVGRQSIKDTVWKGVVCTDENLNNVVSRLRQYLSSDPRLAINTVRGVGFRLTLG